MANVLVRLSHGVAQLPGWLLRNIVSDDANFNSGRYSDLSDREDERRRKQEIWRRGIDEGDPPDRRGSAG
jgi:hypothetical protein